MDSKMTQMVVHPPASGSYPPIQMAVLHQQQQQQGGQQQGGQQPYGMNPAPVVIVQAAPRSRHRENQDFNWGAASKIGYVQVGMGVTAMICNSITLALDLNQERTIAITSYTGCGYWMGFWYILTGLFGVTAAKKRWNSTILTFMLLSLTSLGIFNFIFLWMAAIGVAISDNLYNCGYNRYNPDYDSGLNDTSINDTYVYYYDSSNCEKDYPMLITNSVLLFLAVLEVFVATTSAILCCQALCCGVSRSHHNAALTFTSAIPGYHGYHPAGGTPGVPPAATGQTPGIQGTYPAAHQPGHHVPTQHAPVTAGVHPGAHNSNGAPPPAYGFK